MARIAITGAGGFIGSNLCHKLVSNNDITGIDDFSTGLKSNLSDIRSDISLIEYRLGNNSLSTHSEEFDVMVHLAASVGVKNIVDDPFGGLINNTESTLEAIRLAKKFKVKKFIFLSTSEVYGANLGNLREDMTLMVGCPENYPRNSYAAAKILDEFAVLNSGLDALIIRPFNIVGPKQRWEFGMVLPRFMRAAISNQPLEIYNDGNQVRTFTSINDLVEFLDLIISGTLKFQHKVYNFGSNNVMSINDLAQKVIQMTGSRSGINYIDAKKVYNQSFCEDQIRKPDLTRLSKLINVKSFETIEEIIDDILFESKSLLKCV